MILHSESKFRAIKNQNKHALAGLIESKFGLEISPDALFDVQIKRLHEYKRMETASQSLAHPDLISETFTKS